MKSSTRHPKRWLGRPVFKLGVDERGREKKVDGKVLSYVPNIASYMLVYTDKSEEVVPVDEIDDFVPLLPQLSSDKRNARKRKTQRLTEEVESDRSLEPIAKKFKVLRLPAAKDEDKVSTVAKEEAKAAPAAVDESRIESMFTPSAGEAAIKSKFVQDALWSLTPQLDVSNEKRMTLLASLDNRFEQPRAALMRFIEEDGLEAVSKTLRNWADEGRDKDERDQPCRVSEKESPPPENDATSHRASTRATKTTAARKSSPCGGHLHDLMLGKCESVFSPKRTQPKERHAPSKRNVVAQRKKPHRFDEDSHTVLPPRNAPELFDLTGDEPSDEEETEYLLTACAGRRLRFGPILTVVFSKRDSVDKFRSQLRRNGFLKREIKQNPEAWNSVLKKS